MELIIDTSDKTYIALSDKNKIIGEHIEDLRFSQSERLLEVVNTLLEENHITKNQLQQIFVNTGPGSYTGIRVGVTTANFLAFSLNIPVLPLKGIKELSKTFQKPVLAKYIKPPFITKKKPGRS
jgi:tRNA threonylcarbamoyladenosine biosynthesis protein TsaB